MHTYPSCNLRSKYIRTIPINTVIIDPVNKHKYFIEERKLNNSLVKVTTPYFGSDGGIELEVEQEHLKLANPKRANPSIIMKNRINELEAKVSELNKHLSTQSTYQQIKNLLNSETYYDDRKYLYTARDGIVFAVKLTANMKETERVLEEYVKTVWKSPEHLHALMVGQKRLQA